MQRCVGPSDLIAKTTERLNIRRMEESSIGRPELPKSDRAAVVIQVSVFFILRYLKTRTYFCFPFLDLPLLPLERFPCLVL